MKKQKLSKEALEVYNALMNLSEEEKQLVFRKVPQPETLELPKHPRKRSPVAPIV